MTFRPPLPLTLSSANGLRTAGPLCQRCRRRLISQANNVRLPDKPLGQQYLQIRFGSSSSTVTHAKSIITRLKNLLLGTTISIVLILGYAYATDTRSSFQKLTPSVLRLIYPDAEDSHHAGNYILKALYRFGLHPRERGNDGNGDLAVSVFDHIVSNPIGVSAGLDKDGAIPDALFAMGPSIVEIGGCTPLPQAGNPRPRVFRLPSVQSLINRYGLNSGGAGHTAMLLRKRVREYAYTHGYGIDEEAERRLLDGEAGVNPGSLTQGKLLAVQIAKNAATPADDLEKVKRDYTFCVERLGKYADILVVNVSSPNTTALRGLQAVEPLTGILRAVVDAAKKIDRRTKPVIMVKVSPDEDSEDDVRGVCAAVCDSGADGVVVANSTISRPVPVTSALTYKEVQTLSEQGGYSGTGMFEHTRRLVRRYRYGLDELTPPRKNPKIIFASGGITNGVQALQVLEAGASVAMVYTALVYDAGKITRMKGELREEMKRRIEAAARGDHAENLARS